MTRLMFMSVLLLGAILFSLTIGRYPLQIGDVASFFLAMAGLKPMAPESYQLLYNVIVEIRLPRILGAALVGAALASSGAAFQAVFRNPLVSPGILGVLGGASFGAALGILLFGNWALVQLSAFVMGLVAVSVGLMIANMFGKASMILLVLGGMISAALFTSALSIVKYTADPYEELPAIVYWLMGSLGGVDMTQIRWAMIPIIGGLVALSLFGRALDALSMGDDEARALGVPAQPVRYGVIGTATLVSALSVSLAGMIGWVGLVVPHVVRLALGPGNARLLPTSAFCGAIFLIGADCLSRSIMRSEIPIGILTELLGIPAFIIVLRRARSGWT
ncbi:FecCD family ABC transporter permease [Nitrobacter winogradskyi]|uniref:Iron complex transport system permease protein n=2 Tax=Nitrobacter winogradskyi TaxID=913 RepID=A0ACC6ADQ1_NITWI|nr:iron ABC transporter permease [Nitrobacter winogradskyi]MCP1997858.1 iron complex transport system permease protein [Nitrobacter winogradskyi]GEC17515.1 iron ABC transporter permease [Nitrobacter winogradskyi]